MFYFTSLASGCEGKGIEGGNWTLVQKTKQKQNTKTKNNKLYAKRG